MKQETDEVAQTSDSGERGSGHDAASRYRLQRMKLSGANSYVCLIPPPVESHTKPPPEPPVEPYPAIAWSQLTPLANTCLYVSTIPAAA